MKLSRRAILAGAGASLLAGPFAQLYRLRSAHAQARPQQRLLIVASYFGTVPSEWRPDGGERDFRLRSILEPLEPFRSKLLIIDGVGNEVAEQTGGDGHARGVTNNLTGYNPVEGGRFLGPLATRKSFDMLIADHIGASSQVAYAHLALQGSTGGWSWNDVGRDNPPIIDPSEGFRRLFGSFRPMDSGPDRQALLRRSILDHQLQRFGAIATRLPAADRRRFEEHLSHLRDLERRLATMAPAGATCTAPSAPAAALAQRERLRYQADLIASALICGVTRVGMLIWRGDTWDHLGISGDFGAGDMTTGDHSLSHTHDHLRPGTRNFQLATARCRFQAEELAHILQRLNAIPEGGGTVLDNTLVFWTNELATGFHTHRSVPYVIAGNIRDAMGAPRLRTGRYLRFPEGTPVNRLYVALANAFGIPITQFGDTRFSSGTLDAIY